MDGKKKNTPSAKPATSTGADANKTKNPITVRLPSDIREAMDGLLKKHPLIKQAMFLQFAVSTAVGLVERDPGLIEEFARQRQSTEE